MARKHGFFQSAMEKLIAARTRQVNHQLGRAFLTMNDEQLKMYGYTRDELKRRMGVYY